jgi:ferric-dicitrate binding protein FerR (iron transport regulator)
VEQLFRRYLANQCTLEEIQEVVNLLQTLEGKNLMERLLNEIPVGNHVPDPSPDSIKRGWQRLNQHISSTNDTPVRVVALWGKRALRVAAVVLPLLIAGAYFLGRNYLRSHEETAIKTDFAQVRQITLPDGSVVTLNGNSTLTYAPTWSAFDTREVWLTGEAFFQVTHTKNDQKFLVHTRQDHTIEVLGTEFNVSDRKSGTKVVLKSGKIKLTVQQNQQATSLVMKPGQLVAIDTTAQQVQMNLVKPDAVASWRNQKLVFDGVRLGEIAEMLKETYNLKVTVTNQHLLEERISGTIPSGNINELIQALSIALKVKYKQETNQVNFY